MQMYPPEGAILIQATTDSFWQVPDTREAQGALKAYRLKETLPLPSTPQAQTLPK